MKIDLNENAFWASVWISISLGITLIVWTLSSHYNERALAAFENGYEEATLQGISQSHWVKSD